MSGSYEAIDALFERGELPEGSDAAHMLDAMRSNTKAQRRFDALALADRELTGAEVSDFERAFGEAAFFSGLDAMLEEERAEDEPSSGAKVIPLFGPRARVAALAAGALVASGLAWWAFTSGANTTDDGFQPRSAVTSPSWGIEGPEIAVFCVQRDGAEVRFTGAKDSPMGVVSCPQDAELKLAHADSGSRRFVAMLGVSRDGERLWYGPSPARPGAMEAKRPSGPMAGFGESIRLGINHEPGEVRVHALFSDEPLTHGRVEELIARWPGGVLFEHARLPIDGVATSSVTFEVRAKGETP